MQEQNTLTPIKEREETSRCTGAVPQTGFGAFPSSRYDFKRPWVASWPPREMLMRFSSDIEDADAVDCFAGVLTSSSSLCLQTEMLLRGGPRAYILFSFKNSR